MLRHHRSVSPGCKLTANWGKRADSAGSRDWSRAGPGEIAGTRGEIAGTREEMPGIRADTAADTAGAARDAPGGGMRANRGM